MSKSKNTILNPAVVANVDITSRGAGHAIDITGSTMALNTQATIQMGSITLTEDKFAKMEAMLEFFERFTQEDERAKAIWIAIRAKKRILT